MKTIDHPARFTDGALICPPLTPLSVLVTLRDFVIVTFAVAPADLARHLPPGFEPEVRTLKDGSECAFVSAVTFRDKDFRLSSCPWPTFSFGQTNYRAYVIYQGKRIAWFFGTSLATPFVMVPRYVWMLPWHHASIEFSTRWSGDQCFKYEQKTSASWAPAELILESTGEPMGCLDGFFDEEDTAVVLTHPLTAYYNRRDRKLGTYAVWHDKLQMQRCVASKASFELFHQLGLTTPESRPHSVLIQKGTDFAILLPPRVCSDAAC